MAGLVRWVKEKAEITVKEGWEDKKRAKEEGVGDKRLRGKDKIQENTRGKGKSHTKCKKNLKECSKEE